MCISMRGIAVCTERSEEVPNQGAVQDVPVLEYIAPKTQIGRNDLEQGIEGTLTGLMVLSPVPGLRPSLWGRGVPRS